MDPDKSTVTLTVHADVTKGSLVNLQVVYSQSRSWFSISFTRKPVI